MKWLILIGGENFNLDVIRRIKHEGCIECYDVNHIKGRYCVNYGQDHVFYDYQQNLDDFEDDLVKVPYSAPNFITMIYTSTQRARSILQLKSFPHDIYVDNDDGLVLPIDEFIRLGMPLAERQSQ